MRITLSYGWREESLKLFLLPSPFNKQVTDIVNFVWFEASLNFNSDIAHDFVEVFLSIRKVVILVGGLQMWSDWVCSISISTEWIERKVLCL